jgi:hypothetical protein
MPVNPRPLTFGEYRPDLSDINTAYSALIRNVLPRADGYMPFNDFLALTFALPAPCRGFFFARNVGTLNVFAGTETRLYLLNNTTLMWDDVSKGGSAYAALTADAQWQFTQFNDVVIAVQENVDPQAFDVTGDTEFDDLGGSPPQARYVAVVNRFVVLSGLLDNPYRVQWSGLDAITNWTAGSGLSDFQDLPDGGTVRGTVGGEFGIIIQDLAMRRMIFSPGSDVVFQIDRISKDTGALAPYSIVNAGERVFFLSSRGFIMTDQSGSINPIGKERVDRTFLATYDSAALQLVIGASDPANNLVFWSYKSLDGGVEGLFDRLICYDWALDRWSDITMTGEYLAALARPGLTLESLDSIGALTITGAADNGSTLIRITVASTATLTTGDYKTISGVTGTTEANGDWFITVINGTTFDLQGSTFANAYVSGGIVAGSLDDLPFSLDSIAVSDLAQLAMASSDHTVGFFTGDTLEAVVETSEQVAHGMRQLVNGLIPMTDADSVFISVSMRDRLNIAATYGEEAGLDDDGHVPVLEEGRYLRARLRLPAGTTWTYATGIVPDNRRGGMF